MNSIKIKFILSIIITAILGFGVSFTFKPLYTADTSLVIHGDAPLGILLKSRHLSNQIIKALPEITYCLNPKKQDAQNYCTELLKSLKYKAPTKGDTPYVFSVRLTDPELAAKAANLYVEMAIDELEKTNQLIREKQTIKLDSQFVPKIGIFEESKIIVIDKAHVPDKPLYPNRALFALVGAILGFLFAVPLTIKKSPFQEDSQDTNQESSINNNYN